MGRLPDAPEEQRDKGFPGKRKSKVEAQIAEAARQAALLADAPGETADPLAPPALIADERLAPALAVWRDYAPRLAKLNLLEQLDRHTFAMFCVYMGEFAVANQEVLDKGYSVMVKTVSGDEMPRVNPAVERRDLAAKFVLELSRRFGLTPLDRSVLITRHAGLGAGPLFGDRRPEAPTPAPAEETDAIGVLGRLDSTPPPRPN